jgi:hypothetical protein
MRPSFTYFSVVIIVLLVLGMLTTSGVSRAAGWPSYMDVIAGSGTPASKSEVANQNVLALDLAMFGIYNDALVSSQRNFLQQHPVILALFTNKGGKLILYRPGKAPLQAPEVPIRYQLYKSVAHSSMALFELTGSHLSTFSDQSWRAPMVAFRAAQQSALDSLDQVDLSAGDRKTQSIILKNNIKFMDACLRKGSYTFADIQSYTKEVKPYLAQNIAWAATTQVDHWMKVMKGWKEMLGADWDKTYGASNTLYVARQNNVLFSVIAQFFGQQAMNSRLFLFETSAFVTTPKQMLEELARTVADRAVGMAFFGNYYLMDYELMGGNARMAIEAQDKKYGIPVYLPPLVPFHSWEWPFLIDPSQGEGPATIGQIK